MASVLELQSMSSAGGLQAHSTVSFYRCGKVDKSTISVGWCGTNLITLK